MEKAVVVLLVVERTTRWLSRPWSAIVAETRKGLRALSVSRACLTIVGVAWPRSSFRAAPQLNDFLDQIRISNKLCGRDVRPIFRHPKY